MGALRRHVLPDETTAQGRTARQGSQEEWSATDRALLDDPRAAVVWAWLEARFLDQDLDPGTSPQLDLGIDSLDWVDLACALERESGVVLTEEALARVFLLRDLLRGAPAPTRASRSTR